MKIGVTGATGLLGWHFCCRLRTKPELGVTTAGREEFAKPSRLEKFVRDCDVIVHFAGVNRGEGDEIEGVNRSLAETLVAAMEKMDARPHLLFSSSTHVDRDTPYGRSKRAATEIFDDWASRKSGAKFTNLVLPHVFGECGKPFYNSVVSTFCYQLARDEEPKIDRDGELNLLHAQEVADLCLSVISASREGEIRPEGEPLTVSQMLEKVRGMAKSYASGIIPDVSGALDLRLFNTLRSYLYPDFYPRRLDLHSDERGSLFEAVKTDHGGQAFLSTTRPGVTRGEHFHLNKVERFLVVQGDAIIRLRRVLDDAVLEFPVNGDEPAFIDMPTLHTHNIINVGTEDLLTLFWSHEIFNPEAPDTYPEKVAPEADQ